jgi:hydrogenase maturation protease
VASNSITILGLGNVLLGDEGFGVHFIRWLSRRYQFPDAVQVIDGGTLGFGLLGTVCDCAHLIVIDVIKTDDRPGSVYRFTREEMEKRMPPPTSAHEVEFPDVLSMAELMEQAPEVVFLCIVPQRCGQMELEMTPFMHERFADMEALLLAELAARAVQPVRVA